MRDLLRAIAIATILVLPVSAAGLAQSGDATHLTLEQQFGRAVYRACRLDVVLGAAAGRATARCVLNIRPSREVAGERPLRVDEVTRLAALAAESALLPGGAGTDTTAVDGIRETLTTGQGVRTVTTVISGNQSFASGNRKRLIDQLHSLLYELAQK